jgi:hypothetical protein
MSLNAAMIYRRTDRGVREVYEKSHQFTQSERLILILLDGRLNVAGLQARLPSLNDERVERALGKLQDAGLVEPMGSMEAIRASGLVPEAARLEPEAVAHFLEQTDLDPITAFGATEEEVASELVRASVEQAAAQLAREAAGTPAPVRPPRTRDRVRDSVRSQTKTAAQTRPTDPEWDATEATRFAITTVNVPDRLDLQEERDRAEMEEYADERRRAVLRVWMKRLLGAAVAVVVVGVLYGMLKPLRDETSAPRVAERLSSVLKRPVTVAESEFRFTPTPRLVIRGVNAAGQFGAGEVSLLINWKDLWAALRGGQWVWGEATIAPLTLTPAQALAVLRILPGSARELPSKISTIRFESIQITNNRLLPGQYEGLLRRGEDGNFGPLTLKPLDGNEGGTMRLLFTPAPPSEGRDVVDFNLEAERWALPVGPKVRWNEVRANGRIRENILEVSSYALAGFFGVTTGTLFAATDVEWVITGIADATNIDIESVLQSLRPKSASAQEAPATPLQGTATLNLAMVGRGATLDEAIGHTAFEGPFQVRWATLNGINLGLAATQGATAAGTTRFTEFEGVVAASANGVRFEETGGRAGALSARSDFTVASDLGLAGVVRVALGGQSIQAPITLRIRGSALEPQFGR